MISHYKPYEYDSHNNNTPENSLKMVTGHNIQFD